MHVPIDVVCIKLKVVLKQAELHTYKHIDDFGIRKRNSQTLIFTKFSRNVIVLNTYLVNYQECQFCFFDLTLGSVAKYNLELKLRKFIPQLCNNFEKPCY